MAISSQCYSKKTSELRSDIKKLNQKISLKGRIIPQNIRHQTVKREFTINHKKNSSKKAHESNLLRYETCSIKGSKSVNQDYIKCGNDIWILCDDHGQYGHEVSEFVAEILYELLLQAKNKDEISMKKINEVFT